MSISIWRYSHLALAISSFLALTVAAVTGIFLAFEPVVQKTSGYKAAEFDAMTLAGVVPVMKEKFPGIQEITVDDNQHVMIRYTTEKGLDIQAYVNPATGKVLGIASPQSAFFQFMTSLHRSLFLHETGRIIMGITAFLLILISVSGIFLIVQRQNGWRHFFARLERSSFAQYYHVLWGRLSLFFMLAIALTGTYMAVYEFAPPQRKASQLVNEDTIKDAPELKLPDFAIFKATPLSALEKLQYPFSDFPEDYFNIQLRNKEICVNQFTGDILAKADYTTGYKLAKFAKRWHTGRSGIVWAFLMAITSGYILFFIYSGFIITLKRMRSRKKNHFKAQEATIVILVGSENGSTYRFAHAMSGQLLKHGAKVYVTDMNHYEPYPAATQLIIMTSTHGQGQAPANARKFIEKLHQHPQSNPVNCAVLGFGSRSYLHFCRFAYDVRQEMAQQPWAALTMEMYTVNDQSPQDFSEWLDDWSEQTGWKMMMPRELLTAPVKHLQQLKVVSRSEADDDNVFIVRMRARQLKDYRSGDLLAIYPRNDHRERLYSMGIVNKEIQLCVKLHPHGLGSGFLHALQTGERVYAKIIRNKHFHFPQKATQVIMIANGTGIAPFLGMIDENKKKMPVHLYCGFRTHTAFEPYRPQVAQLLNDGRLGNAYLVLSREEQREYVSHRIGRDAERIWHALNTGAIIMICGSLSMQHDVMAVLENICTTYGNQPAVLFLQEKILTDCY